MMPSRTSLLSLMSKSFDQVFPGVSLSARRVKVLKFVFTILFLFLICPASLAAPFRRVACELTHEARYGVNGFWKGDAFRVRASLLEGDPTMKHAGTEGLEWTPIPASFEAAIDDKPLSHEMLESEDGTNILVLVDTVAVAEGKHTLTVSATASRPTDKEGGSLSEFPCQLMFEVLPIHVDHLDADTAGGEASLLEKEANEISSLRERYRQKHHYGAPMLLTDEKPENLSAKRLPGVITIRIAYLTERQQKGTTGYEDERAVDGKHEFGLTDISFPVLLAAPRGFRIWRYRAQSPPPAKVTISSFPTPNTFFEHVKQEMAPRKEILLFVHGYRESFEAAVIRAATITYETKWDGATVVFDWPSNNKAVGYVADVGEAAQSTHYFTQFLAELVQKTGAKAVNVIGHSLGNNLVIGALEDPNVEHLKLKNLILAAPDVLRPKLTEAIAHRGKSTVTLYASRRDYALLFSRWLRLNKYYAAGELPPPFLMNGIETVDASVLESDFLGHSYFSETREVLMDISQILLHGTSASRRPSLHPISTKAGTYFEFTTPVH
jgi:esterase/lipase superfamily enzyme